MGSKSFFAPLRSAVSSRIVAGFSCILLLNALAAATAPVPGDKPDGYPAWWFEQEVIPRLDPNGNTSPSWANNDFPAPDDYAIANIGQLKYFATKAAAELNAHLTGGAGDQIDNLVAQWAAPQEVGTVRDDYATVNIGQIKSVAQLFYDRLIAEHYTTAYPWQRSDVAASDYAAANLGQLKYLFSFDLTYSSLNDGVPDWWKLAAGLNTSDGSAVSTPTGNTTLLVNGQVITYQEAYQQGISPTTAASSDPENNPPPGQGDPLQDLPTITYMAVDVSSDYTQEDVQLVALDDSGRVGFEYFVPGDPEVSGGPGTFYSASYFKGEVSLVNNLPSVFGNFDLGAVNGEEMFESAFRNAYSVNASGDLASYDNRDGSSTFSIDVNGVQYGVGNGAPWMGGVDLPSSLNLGNSGLLMVKFDGDYFGLQGYNDVDQSWPDESGLNYSDFSPHVFSPSGIGAGGYGQSDSGQALYAVGSFTYVTPLARLSPYAVSDSGTVVGDDENIPDSQKEDTLSVFDGTSTRRLSSLLPSQYANNIRFPRSDGAGPGSAFINDNGDIVVAAELLDKSVPNSKVWVRRMLLWHNALSLDPEEPRTLSFVTFPDNASARQFNSDSHFAAVIQVPVSDDEGNPTEDGAMHSAAAVLLPVEFVTKDAQDNFVPQTITWNSVSSPKIQASATASITGNSVSLAISGQVTDATSDCTPTPGKQVSTLMVTGAGGNSQIPLTNSGQSPDDNPWYPYKWEASFNVSRTINFTDPGTYTVRLQTSPNAGGIQGQMAVNIVVSEGDLTHVLLHLPAVFDPQQPDVITATIGTAPSSVNVTLTETGNATNVFSGQWGSATLTLTLPQTPVLTTAVDTISATLAEAFNSQVVSSTALTFVETGATTDVFSVVPSYDISVSFDIDPTPDNFYPTIVRFPDASGQFLSDGQFLINIMDHDWSLEEMTYQGEEHFYVVDDNEKPVVFNPSLYAQTDIQTKPLTDKSQGFQLAIRKFGGIGTATYASLPFNNGLVIYNDHIDDILSEVLVNFDAVKLPKGLRKVAQNGVFVDVPATMYVPKDKFNYKPFAAGDIAKMIRTETLWRYVGTANTVVLFDSKAQLLNDINYRVTICTALRNGSAPTFGNKFRAKAGVWNFGKLALGPVSTVGWKAALANIFSADGPTDYEMECFLTAQCMHLYAVAHVFGNGIFEGMPTNPDDIAGAFKLDRNAAAGDVTFLPQGVGTVAGNTKAIYDWMPGDWGVFQNVDVREGMPDYALLSYENVFYTGGCFDQDPTAFAQHANFWGNTPNPNHSRPMNEWISEVSQFSGGVSAVKVWAKRTSLRQ